MRRRAGVGAIQRQRVQQDKFKEKGTQIQENQFQEMKSQMEVFQKNLETFASKHRDEIKKNPTFRKQFQEMCAAIGVDPLASGKGFWSDMLGVGDFYYELGVQIVELCVASSHKNGGLISVDEAKLKLNARRKVENRINDDDIMRAVSKLKVLGSALEIIDTGRARLISSVPGELSMDHTTFLKEAEKENGITVETIMEKLGWSRERTVRTIEHLTTVGQAWVDEQSNPKSYWCPALFRMDKT